MLRERLRLMSLAGPPNYRRPLSIAWWRGFERILGGFFDARRVPGPRVIDIGAGHFHLSDLARLRGTTVIGVEHDTALAALGRLSGYGVLEMNWDDLSRTTIAGEISGVFSKFSISAIRAGRRADVRALCRRIDDLVGRRGWGWIAPWNGPAGQVPADRAAELVECQIDTFRERGWQHVELTAEQAEYFGVFGATVNRPLFLKRLPWSEPAAAAADDDLAALRRTANANGWLYAEHPAVARVVRREEDFSAVIEGVLAGLVRPGSTILDLRPQYYDLAMNVGPRGAAVISLEQDQLRAARFRAHGYEVLHASVAGAARHLGRESVDGFFSWGHADVTAPDHWRRIASDLRAATPMLRPSGWGWVAIEHAARASDGRVLAGVERQIRRDGWELQRLSPDAAAAYGFRRPNRFVTVASRNGRSSAASRADAPLSRPIWIVGGSPEREWIAAVLRLLGYVNCQSLGGAEADRIPLGADAIVVWYVIGGVSSLPVEIASKWRVRPSAAAAGVTAFPLHQQTTAVVLDIATGAEFSFALDRLASSLTAPGGR